MKKISLSISCCVMVAMVLFNSCSKDGPAGATGPAGPAGPAGSAGAAGPAGPAGTANVIYSDWLDVTFRADTVHNPNGSVDTVGLGYFGLIPATKLTNDILTKGEIKVYFNLNTAAAPAVVPIPYFDGGILINPFFFLSQIELDSNVPASSSTNTAGAKVQQYRYILIPGGTTARSKINWNNYKEVQQYLNLKD